MKKKIKFHYSSLFAIIFIIVSIYLIHSILLFDKIETFLRYVIIAVIVIIDLTILWKLFFGKRKKKRKYIYSTLLILFTLLFGYIGYNLNDIYSLFSNFDKVVIISTSLVSLSDKNNEDLSKLKDHKIGVSIEGNGQELSQEMVNKYDLEKNNTLVTYESYTEAINALYSKEVDYIFLPTNYVDVFGTREGYEDIGQRIKIVDTTQKETTKEEVHLSGSSKDISEPFTILLIGIDSTIDGLQNADSFNGDSLIVVTFNPSTMNATMLSIPRDSYVPITCMNNVENKITHSAASGTKCVINTIQNFLDIKIDYFMKINFTGVVDLVDTLGGVEIDVPYNLCEQDSKRRFGDHMVYIREGHQTLNGEQALAYSRNRKNNSQYCSKEWTQGYRDDFIRSAHQQEVIQAVLNKMKSFSSINDLKKLLEVISKNIDTNMSESTIFSFYNIAKDVMISSASDSVISIEKLYLDGTGQMIYDERSKLVLWDYILNQKSLTAVKKAMKDNLNGSKKELIKTFTYTINENYETKVVGKGYSGTEKYKLLSNLVGMKEDAADSWAKNNGVKLKVEYVTSGGATGTVISQNYPESKRIDLIPDKTVTVQVVKSNADNSDEKVDCTKDTTNALCQLPNFVGKSKSNVTTWKNSISNTIDINYEYEESEEIPGLILKQSIEAKTSVKDILSKNKTLVITMAKAKAEVKDDDNKTDDNKTDDNKPDDNKPDDNKTDDNKTDDNKTDDNKTDDNKADDNKTDDNKTDNKPNDNTTDNTQTENGENKTNENG